MDFFRYPVRGRETHGGRHGRGM